MGETHAAVAVAVGNNTEAHRFEAVVDDETAFSQYRLRDGLIIFVHTIVPPALEGKGVGGALARAGLAFAREQSLKVVATCSFIAGFIAKHPEYQDLLLT